MKVDWERVCEDTYRLKVPGGGWLYRVSQHFTVEIGKHFGNRGCVMNTVFVKDDAVYIKDNK